PGKAFGTYATDVSPWLLSWVIGREVMPWEVGLTNRNHPEKTSFDGTHVRLPSSTPFEAWVAERADHVARLEEEELGAQRPIAFSSWPTLDPLRHPIEGQGSGEDLQQVDFANIDVSNLPGGFYVIFHAYPYYPD